MPLDPQVKALIDQLAAAGTPPTETLTPAEARANLAIRNREFGGRPESVANVENRAIPGPDGSIPVRIYTPTGAAPFPVLVFFHGGGWVVGSPDTVEAPACALANRAGCVVVSVDYRLAPEHKYPAAPEDCYAATCWVAENAASLQVDPTRVAIGGDSAGGNLAAVVALMARDRGGPRLVHQLLVYPVTNHDFTSPSYQDNAEGYGLTRNAMIWFWDQYLRTADDGRHPYASPLLAPDLSGLPPAFVITAEYDPLRDEGETYAERLREAGNRVELHRYDGVTHGFFGWLGVLERSQKVVNDAGRALRQAFAS